MRLLQRMTGLLTSECQGGVHLYTYVINCDWKLKNKTDRHCGLWLQILIFELLATFFAVSKASVCNIRREVYMQVIVKVLLNKYIRIPNDSGLDSLINGFARRGFPNCAGAIDGTHIPIEAPQHCPAIRKGWSSIILQGVVENVDHAGCFNVGWPGRVHDARVLHNRDRGTWKVV